MTKMMLIAVITGNHVVFSNMTGGGFNLQWGGGPSGVTRRTDGTIWHR